MWGVMWRIDRKLLDLCFRTMHAKSDMSQLVRMMPLAVLVPTNTLLGLVMPASGLTEKQHKPFTHAVTIEKMEDRIDVMTSLQRPKKVMHMLSRSKMSRVLP